MKKSIFLLSGIGIGAGLLYALNRGTEKTAPQNGEKAIGEDGSADTASNGKSLQGKTTAAVSSFGQRLTQDPQSRHVGTSMEQANAGADKHGEPEIDDRGTGQQEASQILKRVRDAAFDASDEKLALALGRPTEEIEAWTNGGGTIDGDVVMKVRGLAVQRGVEIQ
jgi:hypothetical protein